MNPPITGIAVETANSAANSRAKERSDTAILTINSAFAPAGGFRATGGAWGWLWLARRIQQFGEEACVCCRHCNLKRVAKGRASARRRRGGAAPWASCRDSGGADV